MNFKIAVIAVLVALCVFSGVSFAAPTGNITITKNTVGADGTFTFMLYASNTVTINDAFACPDGVAISPNGPYAYITNFGPTCDSTGNDIMIINTISQAVSNTFVVNGGGGLNGVAISPSGTYAYVGSNKNAKIYVVNSLDYAVISTISGIQNPSSIAISPNGAYAIATNNNGNQIYVINTLTQAVNTINIPGLYEVPWGVAFSPNGASAYVTAEGSLPGVIFTFNTSTYAITNTITTGLNSPYGITVLNATYAYVVNSQNLSIVNLVTNDIVGEVPNFDSAGGSFATLSSLAYNEIYVTNQNDTVTRIQLPQAIFNVTTSAHTSQIAFNGMSAGAYTINEIVPMGWYLQSSSCSNGDEISSIMLTGGTVACALLNHNPPLTINSLVISAPTVAEGQTQTLTAYVNNGVSPYTYNVLVYKPNGFVSLSHNITYSSGNAADPTGAGAVAYAPDSSARISICAGALSNEGQGPNGDGIGVNYYQQVSDGKGVTSIGNLIGTECDDYSTNVQQGGGSPNPVVTSVLGVDNTTNNTYVGAVSSYISPETDLHFSVTSNSLVVISVACGYGNCDNSTNATLSGETGYVTVPFGCDLAPGTLADIDGNETAAIYVCNSLLSGSYEASAFSNSINNTEGTPEGALMSMEATIFPNNGLRPVYALEANQLTTTALPYNSFAFTQNSPWGTGNFFVSLHVTDSNSPAVTVNKDVDYEYQAVRPLISNSTTTATTTTTIPPAVGSISAGGLPQTSSTFITTTVPASTTTPSTTIPVEVNSSYNVTSAPTNITASGIEATSAAQTPPPAGLAGQLSGHGLPIAIAVVVVLLLIAAVYYSSKRKGGVH